MSAVRTYSLPAIGKDLRSALLSAPLLAVLYAAFTMAGADYIQPGLGRHEPSPAFAPGAPNLAGRYLDRAAIWRQRARPPGLIRQLLHPTLGAPIRLDDSGRMRLVFAEPPGSVRILLLSRRALPELDEHLYALPPLPGGAALHTARLARARARRAGERSPRRPLPLEERTAFATIVADDDFQRAQRQLIERVADDDGRKVRAAIASVAAALARRVASRTGPFVVAHPVGSCDPLAVGEACAGDWQLEHPAAPGLYAVLVVGDDDRLLDWQLNAAYRPSSESAFRFALGADAQWGDSPAVVAAVTGWISMLNALADGPEAPEFVLFPGDVVDCAFGSANSIQSRILGGARDYPRDYLQAWLAFAALRVPIYMVPGNHDGYRFEDAIGATSSDGLLLFESTFGPTYQVFDRPPLRFVLPNSYDLPDLARTTRRTPASEFVESVSDKLNVLNWGGGLQEPQHAWLRRSLGLDGGELKGLLPVLVLHHDPRGAYPALRPEADVHWDSRRHEPMSLPVAAWTLNLTAAPRSDETEEIHAGYYSPIRFPDSEVRSSQWFDLGTRPSLPPSRGNPGWSRYQEEWHLAVEMETTFEDLRALGADGEALVPPAQVLATLVEGRVRAIFKGHDNRFATAELPAGESILGRASAEALSALSPDDASLASLRLQAPLTVHHTADVGDVDTDGHGFLWVEVDPSGTMTVLEIDHAAGAILPPRFAEKRATP